MQNDKKSISPMGVDEDIKETKIKLFIANLKNVQISNRMAALIIAAAIVIACGIFFYVKWLNAPNAPVNENGPNYASTADPDAIVVEVLPQTVRNFDGDDVKNPFTTDEIGNIKVTGIITNSNGKSTAIVETNITSYIVSEGDFMPDSSWQVESITKDSVTFANEGNKKNIYLNRNASVGGQG